MLNDGWYYNDVAQSIVAFQLENYLLPNDGWISYYFRFDFPVKNIIHSPTIRPTHNQIEEENDKYECVGQLVLVTTHILNG